jgi:tetratricopeptide (TPR) repeat protein
MRRAAFTLFLLAALAGCDKHAATSEATAQVDSGPVLDIEVMAFLSEARALHHEANIREDEGDLAAALAAMDRLTRAKRPHDGQKIPEVEEVLADAWARSAELQLKKRDLDGAKKAVGEGLAHAPEPTYFRGHLLEVEGIVEEAAAAEYADAGKKDDAQKARQRAITLLREAVAVQEQVIGKALGDGGKR